MVELLTMKSLLALMTLTALEVVLGIDNLVVIAIVSGKLPKKLQSRARKLGLSLAMLMRIALLLSISWIMKLTATLFTAFGNEISGRDLILLAGGLFLLGKATFEIHAALEGGHEKTGAKKRAVTFAGAIAQILMLDLVFSLDSVVTAVGMADHVTIMIAAIVIAIAVMVIFADTISQFIEHHPTIKMLALSFLLLIGVTLVLEGLDKHVDKAYIYFAMGFSLVVELINLKFYKGGPKKLKPAEELAASKSSAG